MYFTDPELCSYHQNQGVFDKLVNGQCHRCNVQAVLNACITANIRAGRIRLAVQQLRWSGF